MALQSLAVYYEPSTAANLGIGDQFGSQLLPEPLPPCASRQRPVSVVLLAVAVIGMANAVGDVVICCSFCTAVHRLSYWAPGTTFFLFETDVVRMLHALFPTFSSRTAPT
jgi:hypothetical protein